MAGSVHVGDDGGGVGGGDEAVEVGVAGGRALDDDLGEAGEGEAFPTRLADHGVVDGGEAGRMRSWSATSSVPASRRESITSALGPALERVRVAPARTSRVVRPVPEFRVTGAGMGEAMMKASSPARASKVRVVRAAVG